MIFAHCLLKNYFLSLFIDTPKKLILPFFFSNVAPIGKSVITYREGKKLVGRL